MKWFLWSVIKAIKAILVGTLFAIFLTFYPTENVYIQAVVIAVLYFLVMDFPKLKKKV